MKQPTNIGQIALKQENEIKSFRSEDQLVEKVKLGRLDEFGDQRTKWTGMDRGGGSVRRVIKGVLGVVSGEKGLHGDNLG